MVKEEGKEEADIIREQKTIFLDYLLSECHFPIPASGESGSPEDYIGQLPDEAKFIFGMIDRGSIQSFRKSKLPYEGRGILRDRYTCVVRSPNQFGYGMNEDETMEFVRSLVVLGFEAKGMVTHSGMAGMQAGDEVVYLGIGMQE